jgi:hypothetical protein
MSHNGHGGDQLTEQVRAIHVTKGLATSISTDGNTALLKFEAACGDEFGLTFPLPALRMMQAMLVDLGNEALRRKAAVGGVPPRLPATFQVGASDQMRGMTLLMFDDNTPQEMMFALPDDAAWMMAQHMRKTILERKPPAERARLLLADKPPGGIFLPGQ